MSRKGGGGEEPVHCVDGQYIIRQRLTDMASLLLRCSDGGGFLESFLAAHPSVSVSYKVVLDGKWVEIIELTPL